MTTRNFRGAVKYLEGRPTAETVKKILRLVLADAAGGQASDERLNNFFSSESISGWAFFRDIDKDWPSVDWAGKFAHRLLAKAGYQGSEDDLWLSVCDRQAPYRPRPKVQRIASD